MGHRVWKDGTRRGIAYVEGRAEAERVMTLAGRRRIEAAGQVVRTRSAPGRPQSSRRVVPSPQELALDGAMAVYTDRRGRPFAWQIPFDIGHWDQVAAILTVPADKPLAR
jgi:hypothetical protein